MELTYIYARLEPFEDEIRYVGKSDDPDARLIRHIRESTTQDHHCARWIRSLDEQGLRPRTEIIAEVPLEEWEFWERHYIKYFRDLGFRLTNATPGGDGGATGVPRSPETRAKIRASHIGKKHTPETKAKLSAIQKGVPKSPEVRAARKGRKFSGTHLANMSAAHVGEKNHFFGKKHSPEAVEKNRLAHLGRTPSPETIAKRKATRARNQSLREAEKSL